MTWLRSVRTAFFASVAAGIMIGIGGTVLLSTDNRYMGAILFSVALLSICALGLYLFTGKVGYLVESHAASDILSVLTGLFGNMIGVALVAVAVRICRPGIIPPAETLAAGKLALSPGHAFLSGVFCGILMYTAVAIYREKSSPSGIFFCVPVFILSGFEHSIADMFYLFAAAEVSASAFLFLLWVVLGNSVGGMLLPILRRLAKS